ncbi:MAG TPA: hypothetical protein VJP80_02070 [Candidatus Saccharimonadales bacterium]|nr:hypothetical protein [Candidatus Saccharimonadales bacterium]
MRHIHPPLLLTFVALLCAAIGLSQVISNAGHTVVSVRVSIATPGGSASVAPPRHPAPPPFSFPGGGRTLTNTYRMVALYGAPDSQALGALGEQPLSDATVRIKSLAAEYQPLSSAPVYPTFEIIATVASATPTDNGDYSRENDPALLQTWIDAARDAGVYVVLDLQPGRSDFLTQAKEYEVLLRRPNVGLALDPEWRLAPNQLPLAQIGSVSAQEVNNVADWLAALTHANNLPQKLFVLHEFRLDMLPDRQNLNTAHPELAYVIQMDGQGSQPQKQATWQAITTAPPPNVSFGWKNFYHKDAPMLDPLGTMQQAPTPWYISYQ